MPYSPERLQLKGDKNRISDSKSKFEKRSDGGESRKFYQTYAWQKFRKRKFKRDTSRDKKRSHYIYQVMPKMTFAGYQEYLKSNAPLCVHCLDFGKLKAANTLDHISRIRAGGKHFDEMNLQWLCTHHHNTKSSKENYMEPTTVNI